MATTYQQQVIFGQELAAQLKAEREQLKADAIALMGRFTDETLCSWQRQVNQRGVLEARLEWTMYGWSVRHASGLNSRARIAGARDLGGTKENPTTREQAIEAARQWWQRDPTRRIVSETVEVQA